MGQEEMPTGSPGHHCGTADPCRGADDRQRRADGNEKGERSPSGVGACPDCGSQIEFAGESNAMSADTRSWFFTRPSYGWDSGVLAIQTTTYVEQMERSVLDR